MTCTSLRPQPTTRSEPLLIAISTVPVPARVAPCVHLPLRVGLAGQQQRAAAAARERVLMWVIVRVCPLVGGRGLQSETARRSTLSLAS